MENNTLQDFASTSPRIRMSGTEIRPKEVILVLLALALLVFSIGLFFKHWSKNYREINTLPYYAYLYKVTKVIQRKMPLLSNILLHKNTCCTEKLPWFSKVFQYFWRPKFAFNFFPISFPLISLCFLIYYWSNLVHF